MYPLSVKSHPFAYELLMIRHDLGVLFATFPSTMMFHGMLLAASAIVVSLSGSAFAQWAAFYAQTGQCSGSAVDGWKPDCSGTCHSFDSGVNTGAEWGSGLHSTSCSVYPSNDCTGAYESIGSGTGTGESCTNLDQTMYSAICYNNC